MDEMDLITTYFCKSSQVGYHGNLFGGRMLAWLDEAGAAYAAQCADTPRIVTKHISAVTFTRPVRPGQLIKIYGQVIGVGNSSMTLRLEARRHSVYNGTQKVVCTTDMVFVRIDGDGEAIPISQKVKHKYKHLKYCDVKNTAKKIEI